ncbi:response regulator [Sphingomonas sp. SORGH_AS_0879]|uniref:response regulator n=1 Tax=Sphingomonas sp. SORGH_AS_0879 TaxID=3041790 RepID=UPI0027834156|nr:response regulator [Sphingomonas sp. SORGH_AS_0879]MDQ1230992.1 CheY-like chemotaxis protein [Sphingomonas sp. SORGH_AS_0879]
MKILLIDDEPFHIRWLAENLRDDGYDVDFARDVRAALEAIAHEEFRALIVDLNIPVFGADLDKAQSLGDIYALFPGLMVASEARNKGYRYKQVILYSAHKEASVQAVADMLNVEYIIKGNTRQVMREIEDVLSYDPTAEY